MREIVKGVLEFQRESFAKRKELFAKLANQQRPEIMFLTCADSRINPHLITNAEPGELFICRNAGNIVPPQAFVAGGVVASLEFAVGVLAVTDIVVCGHTDCGAMKGVMRLQKLEGLPHVSRWLSLAEPALEIVEKAQAENDDAAEMSRDEKLLRVTEQNVLLQLRHLVTHSEVRKKVEAGDLHLHGWVYHIGTGEVTAFDEDTDSFVSISQRYADWLQDSD